MMFKQKRMHVLVGYAIGVGAFAVTSVPVLAQQKVERVEITGSAIKRSIDSETALPVTVLDMGKLREAGITSVEEAMTMLSSNQTSRGSSQAIGSGTAGKAEANLRGLGSNKTLVLLNGRRLAAFAFDSASVDLNAIPLAAVDRIEILRDGASAIYGTDAIGGVINFITKRNFDKGEFSAELTVPKLEGGGQSRFSLAKGFGSLDKDGWNAWMSFDHKAQEAIAATQREFGRTGVDLNKGLNLTSGTTFPGNFSQGALAGNTTRAAGCKPPFSLPLSATTCRFDYTAMIDIVAPTETDTVMGRANFKWGNKLASIEVLHSENTNTARVAPDPVTGITMTPASPFYPATFPGIDPTKNITVGWRMIPAGRRTNIAETSMDRVVATLSGSWSTWDYDAGVFWTQSKARDGGADGYVNAGKIKAGVLAGTLNPFADPTAAQQTLIDAAKMIGLAARGKGTTKGADVKISGEVFDLPGGKIGLSAGLEARKEDYRNDTYDDYVTNVPSMGRDIYHAGGDRDVKAFTLEALLPITKQLEIQLATRMDRYSDFGSTTNPKIGFKFKPLSSFLVRGSYNRGFRAPTLDELYGPNSITFSANSYNDPVLCPGGVVNAAAGGLAPRDCDQQVQAQQGGNKLLKPETSKTSSLGAVFQPTKDLQFSLDYWKINMKDQIAGFPEQSIMGNPGAYGAKIVRCPAIPVALQATLTACQGGYLNGPGIGYIITTTDNLGEVKTNGFDLGASYAFKIGNYGHMAMTYSGTRVNSYQYQNSKVEEFKENVGKYVDSSPVFRWQHVVGVNHTYANWSTQLIIRNKSSYIDQDPANTVKSYTLTDLVATYSGFKNVSLTAGVKNLLDKDPPFSNQGTVFQKGYDPRYTDAIGRAVFVRGSYKF
ncbi:MAG: TonB-dependent receptor [Betaproteobacteria bacterium]|nr:MAG: TonB-dependent receptor [Betaproteobacteria bacterium]